MPELPDIEAYLHALRPRTVGCVLQRVRLGSAFVLRTVEPPLAESHGRPVTGVGRIGKRIVLSLEGDLHLVVHLMIAGRLHWRKPGAGLGGKMGLAAFDFESGTLLLTEAATRKRAALYTARGAEGLAAHDRGGIEPLLAGLPEFGRALRAENHTLKRALTDPRLFGGIGNAYSDEILHAACLSPFALSRRLSEPDEARLYEAVRSVLQRWTTRLVAEAEEAFPEKVTAFRPEMAVHGRYGQPCPRCGGPVQRIVYAENEANYCPACQTGGKLLADRALSRLLREDWPRTLQELEEFKAERRPSRADREPGS